MAGFKNVQKFKIDLKKFGELTEEKFLKIFKKIALDLDTAVVMGTPVDTGRARGNWYVSLGAPSGAISDRVGAGPPLKELGSKVNSLELGDIIWMSNNLPYINRLEHGWSKQAPAGMVAINVARFRSQYGG